MNISFPISARYLWIPVVPEQPLKKITITASDRRIYEFMVPVMDRTEISKNDSSDDESAKYPDDSSSASYKSIPGSTSYNAVYYSAVPVSRYMGMTVTVKGDFPESFASAIKQEDSLPDYRSSDFPIAHFAAPGWINDPNGLVYVDGLWHLYFQYNPFDTRWQNMSWGHAVSNDLLNWTQRETALFPDETGTMFSGSCLPLDEDHLVFFYTSAGDGSDWGKENDAPFAQHTALSTDRGDTLVKTASFEKLKVESILNADSGENPKVESILTADSDENLKVESILTADSGENTKVESIFDPYGNTVVDQIAGGNRDPKVYKDEINGGYYMVLFLSGNEYAIFHSVGDDYTRWENTQRFEMAPAWECPDLRLIPSPSGKTWVFWSSDGFYQTGSFDGYHFTKDSSPLKRVYLNSLAYAGQTYQIYAPDRTDSFSERVVLIHWLRTSNKKHNYTGMMGIPREMHLNGNGDLCLTPAREWTEKLTRIEPRSAYFQAHDQAGCPSEQGKCDTAATQTFTEGDTSISGRMVWTITEESALELDIERIAGDVSIDLLGQKVTYNADSHTLSVENGNVDFHKDHSDVTVPDMEPCTDICFGKAISDLRFIMDRGILEVSADGDSLNAFFEIPVYKMAGTVTVDIRHSDNAGSETSAIPCTLYISQK